VSCDCLYGKGSSGSGRTALVLCFYRTVPAAAVLQVVRCTPGDTRGKWLLLQTAASVYNMKSTQCTQHVCRGGGGVSYQGTLQAHHTDCVDISHNLPCNCPAAALLLPCCCPVCPCAIDFVCLLTVRLRTVPCWSHGRCPLAPRALPHSTLRCSR
jgi:hypothetical protein